MQFWATPSLLICATVSPVKSRRHLWFGVPDSPTARSGTTWEPEVVPATVSDSPLWTGTIRTVNGAGAACADGAYRESNHGGDTDGKPRHPSSYVRIPCHGCFSNLIVVDVLLNEPAGTLPRSIP